METYPDRQRKIVGTRPCSVQRPRQDRPDPVGAFDERPAEPRPGRHEARAELQPPAVEEVRPDAGDAAVERPGDRGPQAAGLLRGRVAGGRGLGPVDALLLL